MKTHDKGRQVPPPTPPPPVDLGRGQLMVNSHRPSSNSAKIIFKHNVFSSNHTILSLGPYELDPRGFDDSSSLYITDCGLNLFHMLPPKLANIHI